MRPTVKITIDPRNLTKTQFILISGITAQTLDRWTRDGCPLRQIGGKKTYDLKAVLNWKNNQKTQPKKINIGDDDEFLASSESSPQLERGRKVKADLLTLEYKKRVGELIELEKHEEIIRECADLVRKSFQEMPKRLCSKLAKESEAYNIERTLNNEINGTLRKIAGD